MRLGSHASQARAGSRCIVRSARHVDPVARRRYGIEVKRSRRNCPMVHYAEGRPLGDLTLRTLAMPSDANAAGDIFGGWVMAQMDLACGIRAAERAKGRVVTAAVKEMSF